MPVPLGYSINFRDLSAMGFTARAVQGWLDGPTTALDVQPVTGRAGVLVNPALTGQARELTITLTALCQTLAERTKYLATLTQLTQGVFWLGTPDRPTQSVRCRVRSRVVNAGADLAAFVVPTLIVTLKLLAADGVSVDRYARIESLTSTGTVCPIGTGTTAPLVILHGAWTTGTSRTLTYLTATGASYGTLVLTAPASASLASGDTLEVDMGAQTITRVTAAGARSNGLREGWLASGDFFVLDPSDDLTNAPPLVAVSSGSAEAVYLNTWML